MIKILLKIWPALSPIILYAIWSLVFEKLVRRIFRKKDYIEGEFDEIDPKTGTKRKNYGNFSLKNPIFVAILYFSLILTIFSLIFLAFKN